jgi:hypothetical protein
VTESRRPPERTFRPCAGVYPQPMARIRVAEVFAALSLTTDPASGVPFEKGLRT